MFLLTKVKIHVDTSPARYKNCRPTEIRKIQTCTCISRSRTKFAAGMQSCWKDNSDVIHIQKIQCSATVLLPRYITAWRSVTVFVVQHEKLS